MKLEEVDIDSIKPYKNNPREIPMESVQKVMNSIREFGNNQPIVVDKDNGSDNKTFPEITEQQKDKEQDNSKSS